MHTLIRLAVLSLILAFAAPALAQTAAPQFGGCFEDGSICLGPSVSVTVGQYNFDSAKFSGGIQPGIGYGVLFAAQQWYKIGLDGYLAFTVSQGTANQAIPALMLSFANYVRVGAGLAIIEKAGGGTLKQPLLMFGFGSNFGGSPEYVKLQAKRAVQAAPATPAPQTK